LYGTQVHLPCPQELLSVLCPQLDEFSSPPLHPLYLRFILTSSHVHVAFQVLSSFSDFCMLHDSPTSLFDVTDGGEYTLRNSPLGLYSFLHRPVSSSLTGPNILLCVLFISVLTLEVSVCVVAPRRLLVIAHLWKDRRAPIFRAKQS